MSNVEGVAAEETTVQESVENTTPETEVVEDTVEKVEARTEEPPADEQEASEEVDYKSEYEKLKAEKAELEVKTKRQTAANRATQERYEEALAERKKLQQEILDLKKPNIDDFETDEDYDKAISEYEDKRVDLKAEEKAQQIEEKKAQAEKYNQAREAFNKSLEEIRASDPDVDNNLNVVAGYLEQLPKEDPGVQSFREYIAMETELGAALANHLGKNPEIIEDQLIGKPWFIVKQKLQRIEKELSVPKPPETQPLPKPLSKTKGAAIPKDLSKGDVLKNLGLK